MFRLKLDLDLTCEDNTVQAESGKGINDVSCNVKPGTGVPITDLVPAEVDEIQLIEVNQRNKVLRSRVYGGGFLNGDVVEFKSLVALYPDINSTTLPRSLSVTITGKNAAGQPLLNTWGIEYSNDCTSYPILNSGQKIGWTVFVSHS